MGILKHLLFWPVTGPGFLAQFSLEKVQGVVRDELTDDGRVKEGLLDLQLRLELGEIDEETFEIEEARLMAQLREVRRWREEFGMGTRGGVVRMAAAEVEPEPEAEAGGPEPEHDAEDAEAGEPPRRPLVVPAGATLEISLDWDEPEPAPSAEPDDDEEEGR